MEHNHHDASDHGHHGGHIHAPKDFGPMFAAAAALSVGLVAVQVFYGIATHSVALLALSLRSRGAVQADRSGIPPGSTQPPTAAKPVIWQQWDDFTEKAKKLESEIAKLSATGAADGDGLRMQFRAVAYICDGCHETYRVPKTNR